MDPSRDDEDTGYTTGLVYKAIDTETWGKCFSNLNTQMKHLRLNF